MSARNLMDELLRKSKNALPKLQRYAKVRIVMGNSACDLDSAVCTLVQGCLEQVDMEGMYMSNTVVVIPLMNIPRKEYRLKTEVTYFFKRFSISPDLLTFRDEIDLEKLGKSLDTTLEVVLVDHHALPEEDRFLTDSVIKVIDHRPRDKDWPWSDRVVCIKPVGSCATLVARHFLKKIPEFLDYRIINLLRGAILIDTCNLSVKTKRATSTDIKTLAWLESLTEYSAFNDPVHDDRISMYTHLIRARNDITELSIADLLNKDVKVVEGIPIAVLPLSIRKLIHTNSPPTLMDPLCNFAVERNTRKVVLIGTETVAPDQQKRDCAFFSLSPAYDSVAFSRADAASLRSHQMFITMCMEFHRSELHTTNGCTCLDINGKWEMLLIDLEDVTVTRKQILPKVREMVRMYDDFKSVNQSRPPWL